MTAQGIPMLQQMPLLSGLRAEQLEELAHSLRARRYARGEVIFHRDDPGDSLYIIEEGSVKIALSSEDGREVTLTTLTRGGFFGELALLDGEPRSADAVAMEPSRLLRLPRDTFLHFLERNPSTAPLLLATMSRQVRRLTEQVYDAAFLDLPTRLAKAILHLAEEEERSHHDTTLRLTQAELAAMVGATRESVNKWLQFYQRRGLIRLGRGTIAVLKPSDLQAYGESYSFT